MDIELSKKYSSLLTSDCRYHVVTGGRGSGKSFAINTLLCYMMMEQQRTILFLRKTLTSAHLSIIPEFLEKLELLGVKDQFHVTKTEIINKINGSIIYFRGIQTSSSDNTANLKSINGVSVAIIDEAEELTDEATFDRLDLSIRKKGVVNKVIVALNPCSKVHFIYRRFFEEMAINGGYNGQKENVNYIHTTYLDNIENLDESFIFQANLLKERNPKKYNHVLLGGWLEKSEGVIFENWEVGEFKESDNVLFGQDFGFASDPTTLVKVSIEKSAKKIYLKEFCYKTQMNTDDIAELMKRECGNNLVIGDNAEPRLIDELSKKGINIKPCIKGAGSVKEGIALMLDYNLIVSADSTNLIKELNNYSWSQKSSETPIDAHNHCFIGSTLISTINGQKPIKDINVGDFVLTRNGYKKVLKKFNNGVKKVNRYLMQFDTFSVYLCSTDNHLIYTNKKWEEISKLKKGMTIDFNKHLMELHTSYTEVKNTLLKANGKKEQNECTSLFGNTTMAKYQKDIMSIIKMKTHGTTELTTSNVYHKKNTLKGTKKKHLKGLKAKSNLTTLKKLGYLQKNGINQKRVENGISNTLIKWDLENLIYQTENATNVNQHTSHRHIIKHSVQTNVNLGLEESQGSIMSKKNALCVDQNIQLTNIQKLKLVDANVLESWHEEVFDIMVEDEHEYFANGVLVHNCIDAARYAISHALTQKERVIDFGWG